MAAVIVDGVILWFPSGYYYYHTIVSIVGETIIMARTKIIIMARDVMNTTARILVIHTHVHPRTMQQCSVAANLFS